MGLSKTKIRKLGDRIRTDDVDGIDPSDIALLEEHRISHSESVSSIFSKLYKESKKVRHDSITTYRLKRIESIIRKLYRFPSMELDRMWDLAGCRCILNAEDKVENLRQRIHQEFHVVKENNYYLNPSLTGYKSVHLYITETKEDKWPIEVQLRTKNDHNWATLVEIIDQLYEKNIKEGEKDPKFETFFILLSRLMNLEIHDKIKLIGLTHELSIFQKLHSVFIQNYLKVRYHWLVQNKPKSHHFYVIEVWIDQPNITSYQSFEEAEEYYFKKFNSSRGSNIVLTYLSQSNFDNLETAYSNYTLTTHTFIDDYFKTLSEVCGYLVEFKEYAKFYKFYRSAQTNLYSNLLNIEDEYLAIEDVSKKSRTKIKYWKKDFAKRVNRRSRQLIQLTREIEKFRPTKGLYLLYFNYLIYKINKRENEFFKEYQQ